MIHMLRFKSNFTLISPHLSIYNAQLTSLLSIFQRLSGFMLFTGFFYIGLGLVSLFFTYTFFFFYKNYFVFFENSSVFFLTFYFFLWWVFFVHIFNGFRFLLFDNTQGVRYASELTLNGYYKTTIFVVFLSVVSVILTIFFIVININK